MSLLEEFTEACHLMALTSTPDGEGGYTEEWSESTAFDAAISADSKLQVVAGESEIQSTQYTLVVDSSVTLPYNAIVKRADGSYLRVTGSSADHKTPSFSCYKKTWCSAEGCDHL